MKLTILLLALSTLSFGQNTPSPNVTHIVEFEPDGTTQAQSLSLLMEQMNLKVRIEPNVKLLTITGPEDQVKKAEDLFHRYYKPKPQPKAQNIELTLYILLGKPGLSESTDVPNLLNPVLAQLRQTTSLSSFRNLETQIIRVREGEKFESTGVLAWADIPDKAAPNYNFSGIVRYQAMVVQLVNLRFGTRVPYKVDPELSNSQYNFREVGISTFFDLKPGQHVVVGKANATAKDGALILILSARLVD